MTNGKMVARDIVARIARMYDVDEWLSERRWINAIQHEINQLMACDNFDAVRDLLLYVIDMYKDDTEQLAQIARHGLAYVLGGAVYSDYDGSCWLFKD